jgi:hypothetical protein
MTLPTAKRLARGLWNITQVMGSEERLEVHMQATTGDWHLHYGKGSKKPDQMGHWATGTVTAGMSDRQLFDVAVQMLTQLEGTC